ncbi:CDK5 regulatory subunit-associated protein 2-like isoform X1 [Centruroides vittatus]|uniref:CDK5 regulatory subunit-associated protein 2-like isoform X1 n=1 Tax=Centruroides vittatus TaxID=120091 RepID=UPI0035105D95
MATFPRTRNSRSVSPPKRKPKLDAAALPFRSANPEPLEEMGESSPQESSNPLSPVAERLAGYVSPLRVRTMKEYDQQICELKKENFHLKLRMYFLEEKMDKKFEGDILDLHKLNLQLQVDAESLRKELEQKHNLLEEALGTLEKLENNHKQEIHSIKTKNNNEKTLLEKKINLLQKQLSVNNVKYGLEELDSSRRVSTSDPNPNPELLTSWTKFECDRLLQSEKQELKMAITTQGQELQANKLQLEECTKRERSLENELKTHKMMVQNLTETLQNKDKNIQQLKEALELKSGAIDMINSAVHTAVYKATMAARKGDKIGITAAREELKAVLRKILLQCNEDLEGIDRYDISERLQYLQEELAIKDDTIKTQQEELEKSSEKINTLQTTLQSLQSEVTQKAKQYCEKDSLINRLQASLKDAECRIENLLKEQNEIITISKKSLQTLQSNIKDKDSMIHDLQKNIKKTLEQKEYEMDKLQKELMDKDRDLALAKHNIDSLNMDVSANKKECEGVKRDLDDYRNKLFKLSNETKNVTENLEIATRELNELRKNKEEERNKLTKDLQDMKKELHAKDCNIVQLQKSIKFKDEELNQIEDDYNKLQNKVEKLENFLMQKEEEVFTSFQIIDEMRRIIQGSISKDKLQETKKFQSFDNQDISQSVILKDLKLKLGNLLNQNYTNFSTEYSKQLEVTVASLLQHVYNSPQKFSQPCGKLEDMQCLLNTFQKTADELNNCKWKKYESKKDSGLNQLSDRVSENQLGNIPATHDNTDNTNYQVDCQAHVGSMQGYNGREDIETEIDNRYKTNIEPIYYYNNALKDLPRSYSDLALRISDSPPRQRSVESLPAEIEMHYEGWSPDFLPPPILPQSPCLSSTATKEKSYREEAHLNNLWSQSLSHFGHSNDIQELKEEICVLVLKLRQLWERSVDPTRKNADKQYTMHGKELDMLQQQLCESEQLTRNLQQHMAEMAIFLKQLLEVEPKCLQCGNSERNLEDVADLPQTSDSCYQFNSKDMIQSQVYENQRYENIDPPERFMELCEEKRDLPDKSLNYNYRDESEYLNSIGGVNRKWWSASPLHISQGKWAENEVTKIPDSDTWNGTEQVVVLEASDSDDILLLLNDRGLPKDVFLCNNLQQSWSSQSCFPIQNSSPCLSKDVNNSKKMDNKFQQWVDSLPDKGGGEQRSQGPGLSHWSSDSDIWSEPDREVSMQRIGVDLGAIQSLSGEPIGPILKAPASHKTHLQPTLNRLDSSDDSPPPTNRTSPSSSSRSNHPSKWKQKLEIYLHKLEGLISTLSLELQHHRNLSGEVVAQLTMLPACEKDIVNSGLSTVVQDYSQTMTLLEERILELVSDNKQLQEIIQKKLSGKGYSRKRTSTSDSSQKVMSRKSKNLQASVLKSPNKFSSKQEERSETESKIAELQTKIKKLESLLDKKNKECERLLRANEILEAKNSYTCPLGRHETEDNQTNTEWDKEEVKNLKQEIEKQEQRERQIECLVLQMKEELEKKDQMWQGVQNKLLEYKDVNEQLELMCKEKDCQLENAYETINKLQSENFSKEHEITKLNEIIEELNQEIEQCRQRSARLEELNDDQRLELEQTKLKVKEIETKCAELQKSLQESNASKSDLISKNHSLEDRLNATEKKLEYQKVEREKQMMENETKAKREKAAIQLEISSLENEIKGLKCQLDHVSSLQMEQQGCKTFSDFGSRKNSIELSERTEGEGRTSIYFPNEQGLDPTSSQEENTLLLDLVTEMRQLRTELNNSLKMRKQLQQQIKNPGKSGSDQKSNLQESDQHSTMSELSLAGSTGTLTGSRIDSPSGASVESSDSFSFLPLTKLREKGSSVDRKSRKKSQEHHKTIKDATKNEMQETMLDFAERRQSRTCKLSTSTESENSERNVEETEKSSPTNRKTLKLELPSRRQDTLLLAQNCGILGGEMTPQSSGSEHLQGSSVDSPVSRAQFSSPDLGIESDPNREMYFPPAKVEETEEWKSIFPSRMSVTSTRSAPITVALDYSPECGADNNGKSHKAVIAQNDYSLHAVGRLEDYELLKKVMEEALTCVRGITSRFKQLFSVMPTSLIRKHEYTALREMESKCHDVIMWLVKGWHLIGMFQSTAYIQEMRVKNVTLSKENVWLQEELFNARDEISRITRQLRDVTDKLQIAKGEKQLMENTITWHLTKTCRKLQEARSNLIRKDILEMQH